MQNEISLISKKEQQIIDNQIEIDWLKQQIQQKKKMLATHTDSTTTVAETIKNLTDEQVNEEISTFTDRLAEIRIRMDIMTQFNLNKIRIKEVLENGHFTLDTLYPLNLLDDIQQSKRDQMELLIKERDDLIMEVMAIQQQLKDIQIKTARLQAHIVEGHQENKSLMEIFERVKLESKKPSNSTSYSGPFPESILSDKMSVSSSQFTNDRSIEKLNEIKNRLEIARNVLMGIILESNIDWAGSRKWSKVMMHIGAEEED
ncbi:unnamed protein product [Cunninghamella blakesleeana]